MVRVRLTAMVLWYAGRGRRRLGSYVTLKVPVLHEEEAG